jgi:AsmA protein
LAGGREPLRGKRKLKKFIIAVVAFIAFVGIALAALPLFLSAESIRAELAARIEAATGRQTRIDGPISLSVFPTARLKAEGIGIAGIASESEAFSVESVSFGLSLLPLLAGNIEVYGVTITRPVILLETEADGGTNWDMGGAPASAEPAPGSIEDMIATPDAPAAVEDSATDAVSALDRLSIGRIDIDDGTIIWRDMASGREERVEALDLEIKVPKLDGAGTAEGSFTRLGVENELALTIGARPDPTKFDSVPIEMTVTSDLGSVMATGTALAGDNFFNGTLQAKGSSLRAFAAGLGAPLPDMPAFGAFTTEAKVAANAGQILIEQFAVDLGGLKATGGAAIGLDRVRPGIGLKVEADEFDTVLFVEKESGSEGGAPSGSGGSSAEQPIDLSALRLFDANIDFSAKQLLIGQVPIQGLGLDVQIVEGDLGVTIRSARVNGAPGTGALKVETSSGTPMVSGTIKMNGLDAAGLVALSGADVPIDAGNLTLDFSFRTRGATQTALIENLDGNGRVSLLNGHAVDLDLAQYVGGDEAANEIDDLDVTADFSSLAEPVATRGSFTWRGERFEIAARGEPRAIAAGESSPVTLEAQSGKVTFGFNGNAGLAGLGKGNVRLATPSLRNLLAWIGQPMSQGGGLANFSIEGAVALSSGEFSFDKAAFTLDGSEGVGTGKVTFGKKPEVSAGLAMSRLDITPYLVASGTARSGGRSGGGGGGGSGGGWSNDRIAFDGLRAIDAQLNLKTDAIIADQIKIGPSNLTVAIAGGKLNAELTEMALYSGIGVGTLAIDGAAETPSVSAFFRLDSLDLLPFLTDALGFTRVEGTGAMNFELAAAGGSPAQLVAALDGKGAIDFRNGAIRGIDIPNMVRNLSVQTLLGWQQGGEQKTEFTQLAATYAIDNGLLTNNDLSLIGPLLRVTGAGRIDIPKRTLGYRVDPKIVASLDGQGSSGDLEGFAVPVRIEGSWDRPQFYPEIDGILQNPQAAFDQLKKLGGGLFGGSGGGQSNAGTGGGKSPEEQLLEDAAKGLGLDGLLGGSDKKKGNKAKPAPQQPAQQAQPAPQPEPQAQPEPAPAPAAQPAPAEPAPAEAPPSEQPPAEQPLPAEPPAAEPPAPPAELAAPEQETPPAQPADPAADLLKSLLAP